MSENKFVHNAIYYINAGSIYPLTSIDIQRFIATSIFPIAMFPPIVIVYLKEKNARVLQSLSEYILFNYSGTPEEPIDRDKLFSIIGEAIVKTGISISDLQVYSNEEFQEWFDANHRPQFEKLFGNSGIGTR